MSVEYRYISWQKIDILCEVVAYGIIKFGHKFSNIVAIGRGGMIPARIIADRLEITKSVFTMTEGFSIAEESNKWKSGITLVVDDIYDTGRTLQRISDAMEGIGKRDVVFATVFSKFDGKTIGNYSFEYGEFLTPSQEWLVFPWEKYEHIKKL